MSERKFVGADVHAPQFVEYGPNVETVMAASSLAAVYGSTVLGSVSMVRVSPVCLSSARVAAWRAIAKVSRSSFGIASIAGLESSNVAPAAFSLRTTVRTSCRMTSGGSLTLRSVMMALRLLLCLRRRSSSDSP